MIVRKFKARMVDDFKSRWLASTSKDEGISIENCLHCYGGEQLNDLSERVSGQVVTLTENSYPVGINDYFEQQDNNFVIHADLFEVIGNEQ